MDITQFLFDAVSTMTGGIITDMKSLLLGAVVISFILMGLDVLRGAFDHMLDANAYNRSISRARDMMMQRDSHQRGSFEWEEANLRYRHHMNDASRHL